MLDVHEADLDFRPVDEVGDRFASSSDAADAAAESAAGEADGRDGVDELDAA